jgi:hypothetical protein
MLQEEQKKKQKTQKTLQILIEAISYYFSQISSLFVDWLV